MLLLTFGGRVQADFCMERGWVSLRPALRKFLSVLMHCEESWQGPDPMELAELAFLILHTVSILLECTLQGPES